MNFLLPQERTILSPWNWFCTSWAGWEVCDGWEEEEEEVGGHIDEISAEFPK